MESENIVNSSVTSLVEDTENLSDKDRALLQKVADSNTQVLIQLKRNKLTSIKFINDTYDKLRELVSMAVIAGSAMWAFHSLPPDMKDKAAQRYVDMVIPAMIATGGGVAMVKGNRERATRGDETNTELSELEQLEEQYRKSQEK